jgi:hypothetical protein
MSPTALDRAKQFSEMRHEKANKFFDHRAKIFTDRTYTGPIKSDNLAKLSNMEKDKAALLINSTVRGKDIIGYGPPKAVVVKTNIPDNQDDNVDFDFGDTGKDAKPLFADQEKKRTFKQFLANQNEKKVALAITKRRKV